MAKKNRSTPEGADALRRARTRELLRVIVAEDAELLALLAGLEDEQDLADARDALEDPSNAERVPWEKVRARLGRS
jgi:hypothetical protein